MKKQAVLTLLALAAPVTLGATTFAQNTQNDVPVNSISQLPKVAPKKQADLETVGRALQSELIEPQNLALQSEQAHWNVLGTLSTRSTNFCRSTTRAIQTTLTK